MAATNPALASLGAATFTADGFALDQTAMGWGGTQAQLTLNTDTGLTHPMQKPAFETELYLINGEVAPLLTLLQNKPMTKKVSNGNTYWWTLDRPIPEMTTATGSVAVGGTTLSLTYAAMFVQYDTVWVPDAGGAYGQVTAAPTLGGTGAGTIVVQWFPGLAPTVAITAAMPVYKIGNSYPEISFPVSHPHTLKVQTDNHFQEFRYARTISDRLRAERWQINPPFGGAIPGYEMEKLHRQALLEEEKTIWFGQGSWAAATAGAIGAGTGTLEGVYYAANALRWNYGGAVLAQVDFEDFVDRGTRHRGMSTSLGQPTIFCSTAVFVQISRWAQGIQRLEPGDSLYGIAITNFIAPNGMKVPIVINRLFDELMLDGLCVMLRMEPGAVALIGGTVCPELKFEVYTVPYGGSFGMEGYRHRITLMIKDHAGHVNILDNVGTAATSLVGGI